MKAFLSKTKGDAKATLAIGGSKSESNRLLILRAFYPNLSIKNLSDSEDTAVLEKALELKNPSIVDVGQAGTAMRFLTAYFAVSEGAAVLLTGSERMRQRPIKILVDSLLELGADIQYANESGFPPLRIKGKKLSGGNISLRADISSQYVSALMLAAPSLKNGLKIKLKEKATSFPYIEMTACILKKTGIRCGLSGNVISVFPKAKIPDVTVAVEADWSSASYFYSLVALAENADLTLQNFSEKSVQGDAAVRFFYGKLGVKTVFNAEENSIALSKTKVSLPEILSLQLSDCPDLAQTIAVTCFGLGIGCELRGLQTLKIKETDRLLALKTELEKLGASVKIGNDSVQFPASETFIENQSINTYSDHRMAMAFAPLAQKFPLAIDTPEVVRKSFPNFWKCLEKSGVSVRFQ